MTRQVTNEYLLVIITCPEAVCFWSLSDVLPAMETCLVTECLEVLHNLPHVLDRHDDEARGAQEEEAAGPRQAGRHGNSPLELSASLYLSIKAYC